MPANTTYHRFRLVMNSPWALGTLTNHNWSCFFSVSGTITLSQTEAEATALDLWAPIQQLSSSNSNLIQWSYYPSGTAVALYTGIYTPGTHVGNSNAYAVGSHASQQLEVAALAHAPVGINSRGKEVYLRHYIHDVQTQSTAPSNLASITSQSTLFAKWNTGAGPRSVVPISPSTGKAGTTWTVEPHAFTHQLRKGKKKKVAKSGVGGLTLDQLIKAAQAGLTSGELLALLAGL